MGDWSEILREAIELGPMVLRQADGLCRLRLRGRFGWGEAEPGHGQAEASAPQVALQASPAALARWACGMVVRVQPAGAAERHGLAFYDHDGQDLLRLDLGAGADQAGLLALARHFAPGAPSAGLGMPGALNPRMPGRSDDTASGLVRARASNARHGADSADRLDSVGPPGTQLQSNAQCDAPGPSWVDQTAVLAERQAQGLALPVGNEALLDVLRSAQQANLPVAIAHHSGGLRTHWRGCLHHLHCASGQAEVQGRGLWLGWREDLPGSQTWLLRRPHPHGLRHSLWLLDPNGHPRLQLAPERNGAGSEPCGWRAALAQAVGQRCVGAAC